MHRQRSAKNDKARIAGLVLMGNQEVNLPPFVDGDPKLSSSLFGEEPPKNYCAGDATIKNRAF